MPTSVDRQYISQWANDILGMALHVRGIPANADSAMRVALINEDTGAVVLEREARNVSVGNYEVQLTGDETAVPGNYLVRWRYTVDGNDDEYDTFVLIGQSNPAYDRLSPDMKDIADRVWIRFADLFDSPAGGPNLQSYVQSHFTRGRIADLLRVGVGRLNTVAQPYSTFTIDGQGGTVFPVAAWGPLLEQVTYVETIKHLMRSYVEQPEFQGSAGGARLDRRDYLQRWQTMLDIEEKMLKGQLDTFKISQMGLGKGRALVAGGAYGRFGPTRLTNAAPRARFWSRFY